jgi:hypothetical protein
MALNKNWLRECSYKGVMPTQDLGRSERKKKSLNISLLKTVQFALLNGH